MTLTAQNFTETCSSSTHIEYRLTSKQAGKLADRPGHGDGWRDMPKRKDLNWYIYLPVNPDDSAAAVAAYNQHFDRVLVVPISMADAFAI